MCTSESDQINHNLFALKFFSNEIITFVQWNCCRMVAHWLSAVKHQIYRYGIWRVRRHASKPNWHRPHRLATHWPSVQIRKFVSRVAATATLPFGICTIRHWYDNFKDTPTVHRASILVRMAIVCGPVAWTTLYARGICEKDDNCNSTISAHKSSHLATVQLVSNRSIHWILVNQTFYLLIYESYSLISHISV